MPILYVHGVNTRSRDGFLGLEGLLRRYVAPAIAADPDQVWIDDAYWGDAGVRFAWGGASRPRSRLLGQGADATEVSDRQGALSAASLAAALGRMPVPAAPAAPSGGRIAGGSGSGAAAPALRLHRLPADALADLLAVTIAAATAPSAEQTRLILAADAVAADPASLAALAAAATPAEELERLLDLVRARAGEPPAETLRGMGAGGLWTRIGDRLRETTHCALGLPAYAVSVAAAELRRPLNDLIGAFAGDVFVYLTGRGEAGAPGPIPTILPLSAPRGGGAEADDQGQDWIREARRLGQLPVSPTTAWRCGRWLADGYRFGTAPLAPRRHRRGAGAAAREPAGADPRLAREPGGLVPAAARRCRALDRAVPAPAHGSGAGELVPPGLRDPLERVRARIDDALVYFRPGGLFVTYAGFDTEGLDALLPPAGG